VPGCDLPTGLFKIHRTKTKRQMKTDLTIDDVRILLESLRYSIERMENYSRYSDESQRKTSLQPLLNVRQKLRDLRDELKGSS
jgi:hypothetical protein